MIQKADIGIDKTAIHFVLSTRFHRKSGHEGGVFATLSAPLPLPQAERFFRTSLLLLLNQTVRLLLIAPHLIAGNQRRRDFNGPSPPEAATIAALNAAVACDSACRLPVWSARRLYAGGGVSEPEPSLWRGYRGRYRANAPSPFKP